MKPVTAEKIVLSKEKIQSLKKYTQEHKTKATIQIINSFGPFIWHMGFDVSQSGFLVTGLPWGLVL